MSDTVTPNLGLTLPVVGDVAGEDLWGQKLNGNFTLLDSFSATALLEAPNDGSTYGRKNQAWTVIDATAPFWDDVQNKPTTFPPALPIPQSGITDLEVDLDAKEPAIAPGNPAYFWRGDKTWQPVPGGSGGGGSTDWNAITGKPSTFPPTLPIAQSGVISLTADQAEQDTLIASKQNNLGSGTTTQYLRGDKVWTGVSWASLTGIPPIATLPITTADVTGLDTKQASQDTAIAGRELAISAGTTAQYWRGDKSWQSLNSTAVGLGNVNNTADINKPISTATQTALNAKEPTLPSGGTTSTFLRGDKTWAVPAGGGGATGDINCGTFPSGTPAPPDGSAVNFYGTSAPAGSAAAQANAITLGSLFYPLAPGKITGIRFYRAHANSAADGKVAIWRANGTLLASATFSGHTGGVGWKTVPLEFVVDQLEAYMIGVWIKKGSDSQAHYWAQSGTFSTTGQTVAGVMTMPPSNGADTRGTSQYNNQYNDASVTDIAFPVDEFGAAGYFIDCDFVTQIPVEPAEPTSPPTGWTDARFATNTPAPIFGEQIYRDYMVVQNRDFDALTTGQVVAFSAGVKFINCRFKSNEGPRVAGSGTYEFIGCYVEAAATGSLDHADGIQMFCSGQAPVVRIIGTRVKMTFEYGFENNCGVFFGDNAKADVFLKNCVFDGFHCGNGALSLRNFTTSDIGVNSVTAENVVLFNGWVWIGTGSLWTGRVLGWTNVTKGEDGTPVPPPA